MLLDFVLFLPCTAKYFFLLLIYLFFVLLLAKVALSVFVSSHSSDSCCYFSLQTTVDIFVEHEVYPLPCEKGMKLCKFYVLILQTISVYFCCEMNGWMTGCLSGELCG